MELCNLLGDENFLVAFLTRSSCIVGRHILYIYILHNHIYIHTYSISIYIYIYTLIIIYTYTTDTESKHAFEQVEAPGCLPRNLPMPRLPSNWLVAYNAALSGQGSDHGWWSCLSMLEAGWVLLGSHGWSWWNPGIDHGCELEWTCHLSNCVFLRLWSFTSKA